MEQLLFNLIKDAVAQGVALGLSQMQLPLAPTGTEAVAAEPKTRKRASAKAVAPVAAPVEPVVVVAEAPKVTAVKPVEQGVAPTTNEADEEITIEYIKERVEKLTDKVHSKLGDEGVKTLNTGFGVVLRKILGLTKEDKVKIVMLEQDENFMSQFDRHLEAEFAKIEAAVKADDDDSY